MTIVTFYSYKGGVGRTMALANVALILARRGLKVLVVDWDLEAPGLEEYFTDTKIDTQGRGLLNLLIEKGNYKDYIWRVDRLYEGASLHLLASGRDEENYYPSLERFNQVDFFDAAGGEFLEDLRNQWKQDYDFVLIDSRTGLSDTSGVCTIYLPDLVVGLFTATLQSVRGTRDVLQLARSSRQRLDFDRPQFAVVPVPCRVDFTNKEENERWLSVFSETVTGLMDDWRPKDVDPTELLRKLAIPQAPELLYGTPLIEGDKSAEIDGPLKSLTRISDLIESGLSDVSTLNVKSSSTKVSTYNFMGYVLGKLIKLFKRIVGYLETERNRANKNSADAERDVRTKAKNEYAYDIFLSFSNGGSEAEWVERLFLPQLEELLSAKLGRRPRIIANFRELSVGSDLTAPIKPQISSSKVFIPILSMRYLKSGWTSAELGFFMKSRPDPLIVPILVDQITLEPEEEHYWYVQGLDEKRVLDFSDSFVSNVDSKRYFTSAGGENFLEKMSVLSEQVAEMIKERP